MSGTSNSEGQYAPAMRRALLLAARSPAGGPNPQVGCVILDSAGRTLAEGFHRGAGTPHAEVAALSFLSPGAANGATAVVTLEPCNHSGRTGPCTEALLAAGVRRVVFAVADPDSVAGGGAHRLAAAGVEVIPGVLAAEVAESMRPWLTATRTGRPFVSLKWAGSLDGRAAAADGSSRWITGDAARADVHRRRSQVAAILVGTGTVLADDPALTARDAGGALTEQQPVAVVLGNRPIPAEAAVRSHPAGVIFLPGGDLPGALSILHERGLRTVLVEGGPTLASAFVEASLVDEYLVYLAPLLLGGPRVAIGDVGVSSIGAARRLELATVQRLGVDLLLIARPEGKD